MVNGHRIGAVGTWDEIRRTHRGAPVEDLGEHALLPGLINAHCHLDYTMLRGAIPRQATFTDWVRAINARKAELTDDDYLTAIAAGFAEAQRFGTTAIVNIESFPHLLPRLRAAPLRTWWCAEMIDVREPVSAERIAQQLQRDFRAHGGWNGGTGLSPHAPFTASAELYREAASVAARENMLLTTHVAESCDEMKMFRDGEGPLFDLMAGIGRPTRDCGGRTPLRALDMLDGNWIVAHLNELGEDDLRHLATAPKFNVVYCPRSHSFFGHTAFQFTRLRGLGFNICIGTDSLASNGSLSLFSEMRDLRRQHPSLSAQDVLEITTLGAAKAVRHEGTLGSLQVGAHADMIAVPVEEVDEDRVYESVVNFDGSVPWLMVAGEVLTRL